MLDFHVQTTKNSVFTLSELLKPSVEKRNTRYRLAIPVVVRVACTLFKLTHGANLTICSEMYVFGQSTVSKMLREVVYAINDSLKQELKWPTGDKLRDMQEKFASLCSLPALVGAIDDVVVVCVILHNVLLKQSHEEVENLLDVLRNEGLTETDNDNDIYNVQTTAPLQEEVALGQAAEKRTALGVYLTTQRQAG